MAGANLSSPGSHALSVAPCLGLGPREIFPVEGLF